MSTDRSSPGSAIPEPSMDEILASIRRILAEDEHAVRPPPRPRAQPDILDLTEALNDDGSVRHIPPLRMAPPAHSGPAVPADGRIEPAAPRPPGSGDRLISDAAAESVAASFARLATLPGGEGGNAALDELVRQTLRPMLQAWLDDHLPGLVERLVRDEIARVLDSRPPAP